MSSGLALILRDLREAGYVTSRRDGRRVFYSVVPEKPWASCCGCSSRPSANGRSKATPDRPDEPCSPERGIAQRDGEKHALEAVWMPRPGGNHTSTAAHGFLAHTSGARLRPRFRGAGSGLAQGCPGGGPVACP